MARGYRKSRRAPKSRRSYRKKSRAVARVPRNMFKQTRGTTFTLSRSIVVSADAAGKLQFVMAMGNLNLRAPKSFDYVPYTSAGVANTLAADISPAHTDGQREWSSSVIGNISAVFSSYRVLKHHANLTPMCITGDQSSQAVESVYQKFAVDANTAAGTVANPLTGYGQATYSKMHAPSNQRMPSLSITAYPSKTSITDHQLIPFKGSGLQQEDLNTTTGDVAGGRTFGFWKLYSEDLAPKVPLFRLCEKITILVTSRKTS